MSSGEHILALGNAINNLEEIDRQLAAARLMAAVRKVQELIDTRNLAEEFEIAKREDKNARTKQVSYKN